MPKSNPSWGDEFLLLARLTRRTLRKWRPALAAAVLVVLAAAAFIQYWPKRWRSEAVVYYREGLQWSATDAPSARRMGQRFKDLLLARTLLTKVIQDMGLYPRLVVAGRMGEAVEEMRLAIGFRIDQSDVYAISYTGDSPGEAQRVVARLTELLIGENARLRTEQTQGAGVFLDAEKKRNETELATKEAALLRFLARHPEFAADQQGAGGGALRGRPRREGDAAGAERESEAVAVLRREEERLRRLLSVPAQARGGADPALTAAKDDAELKLRAAQRELNERRAAFTEQHPDVRAAEAQVKSALEGYKRALDALQAAEPKVLSDRLQQVQEEIAAARRVQAQERQGQPNLARSPEAAQKAVSEEAEWARLNREATEARERLQQLETRQFVASINSSMAASGQSSQIVVIDPAFLPAQPLGPTRSVQGLMGVLAAMVVAFGVALLFALYDDVVYEASDLERLPDLPLLLEIPRAVMPRGGPVFQAGQGPPPAAAALLEGRGRTLGASEPPAGKNLARLGAGGAVAVAQDPAPAGVAFVRARKVPALRTEDPRLVMLNAPDSHAAAAFRVLRHRLRDRGDPRTILVTSARGGEGKSFCAINLALALGEADRARVLLLETNFRAPILAHLFGYQPPVCAGEQLESHRFRPREPWEAVELAVPSLHAIAITPGSTAKPTLDRALNLAVAAFRMAGYDYVIVDSPDVLQSADVNLMQESVDLVMLTVRARVSRTRPIRSALGQIGLGKAGGFALLGG